MSPTFAIISWHDKTIFNLQLSNPRYFNPWYMFKITHPCAFKDVVEKGFGRFLKVWILLENKIYIYHKQTQSNKKAVDRLASFSNLDSIFLYRDLHHCVAILIFVLQLKPDTTTIIVRLAQWFLSLLFISVDPGLVFGPEPCMWIGFSVPT